MKGHEDVKVIVNQEAEAELSLDVTELSWEADETSAKVINVISNGEWTFEGVPAWLQSSKKETSLRLFPKNENTSKAPKTGKVIIKLGDLTKEVLLTQEGKTYKISQALELLTGTVSIIVKGTVSGLYNDGLVLTDETGSILVLTEEADKNYSLGDVLTVDGKPKQMNNNCVMALYNNPSIVIISKGDGTYTYPTEYVTVENKKQLESYTGVNAIQYSKIIGYLTKDSGDSGDYYALNINGASNIMRVLNLDESIDVSEKKYYEVYAYFAGQDKQFFNTILTSELVQTEAPFEYIIKATPSNINFPAESADTTLESLIETNAEEWTYEATSITASQTSDWLAIERDGNKLKFTPKSNFEDSELTSREIKIILTGGTATATIIIKQDALNAGGGDIEVSVDSVVWENGDVSMKLVGITADEWSYELKSEDGSDTSWLGVYPRGFNALMLIPAPLEEGATSGRKVILVIKSGSATKEIPCEQKLATQQ